MADREPIPVLIVGGGPVGLAAALEFGWRGIRCVLVEQGDGEVIQPRQDLVSIRTMEQCRRWGITREVEQAGYPRDVRQDIMYVTAITGYEMGREPRPAPGEEAPPAVSPAKRERCPQNFFDPVLRRAAGRYPCVELRYRTRLVGLEQDAAGVTATLEAVETGRRESLRAAYVIGCDGTSSFVRQTLDIEMEGESVLTNSTNALVEIPNLVRLSNKAPGYRYVLIDEQALWATLVAIDGRDRWRLQVVGSPDEPTLTEPQVHQAIRRALGTETPYKLLSILPWRRRELTAKAFRKGRVFLAGDSAHQMSPTGGFGMNTGLADILDLGWKIEAMLHGWGGPRLLDSYFTERHPVAVRNVKEAADNLRRMVSVTGDPAINRTGAEGEAARKHIGAAVAAAMQREWNTIGIILGYRYDHSPIVWPDGSPTPDMPVETYAPMARPGARAPHVWLADGRSTLDLYKRHFALLCLGDHAPDAAPLEDAARARGVPLEVHRLTEQNVREAYAAPLVLVRPDGHVAWRGAAFPDPGKLIDCVRGA